MKTRKSDNSDETLKRLRAMRDEDIDYSEIPEITPEMMKTARRVGPMIPPGSKFVRVPAPAGMVRYKVVHGGARPGAGRKPTGHVRVGLNISPKAKANLLRRAKREHTTISAVVEALLTA